MSDLQQAIADAQFRLSMAQAEMEHQLAHAAGLKPENCRVCKVLKK